MRPNLLKLFQIAHNAKFHSAEFRVAMASTSTHNGLKVHYSPQMDIIILTVAAISGPHHQFRALHLRTSFTSYKFTWSAKSTLKEIS